MNAVVEKDYVLGTHDEEIERLGLQHRVWRPTVLACWQRAGITEGMRVGDIGAGPGYATRDLAAIVGPQGHVTAVERSTNFIKVNQANLAVRGLKNVTIHAMDLMEQPIPAQNLDAAWCRWVTCFVPSPKKLVAAMAAALKPGGVAIFHEYCDYASWRLLPGVPSFDGFVQEAMQSWRDSGGEPDIGAQLPTLLAQAGLRLKWAEPRVFVISPAEYMWQWPQRFVAVNPPRLVELGRVSPEWAAKVQADFAAAQANPNTRMITPMVLEVVAEKL